MLIHFQLFIAIWVVGRVESIPDMFLVMHTVQVHIFRWWEEAEVSAEIPRRGMENMQAPLRIKNIQTQHRL